MKNNKGFFSMVGLLLSVAIVCFLAYFALNVYFKPSPVVGDKETQTQMSQEGINTSSYQSLLDSTKERIKKVEQQELNRPNEIADYIKNNQ